MSKKKIKKQLEEELLKDPKSAMVIKERNDQERHEDSKSSNLQNIKQIMSAFEEIAHKMDEYSGFALRKNLESNSRIVDTLEKCIKNLESINEKPESEFVQKDLFDMIDLLKQINKKETIVNVDAPIVKVPDPKVIDQTKIIQETKYTEASNQILMKILEYTMRQQGEGVRIKNTNAADAIPVVLTDKTKRAFYNAIDKFVTASGGGLSALVGLFDNYIVNVQVDSVDANLSYVGVAPPGLATSAAVWQIRRVDCTTGTIVLYAGGNDSFDNIFDNREALSYS